MQYPLEEKIGVPELLVEREREAANFGEWLSWIPKKNSQIAGDSGASQERQNRVCATYFQSVME